FLKICVILLYYLLKLSIITTLCIISGIFVFYNPVTNYIIGYEDFNIAVVFALGIIAQLIFRYAQLVIRMQQKGNLYSLLQIFQKLFNLLFIFVVFFFIISSFKFLLFFKVFSFIILLIIALYLRL